MSLISEKKGSHLYLTLNRPQRANSLDPPTLLDLRQTLLEAQFNEEIKVIILTSMGNRDFTTGIDISSVITFSADGIRNLANVAGDISTLLYYGKPNVIAINGRAMGMGVVFPVAGDYRLIVEGSQLRMPEVNIPAFPGASCIALMTRVCGIAWTRRILMLGLPFDSTDAINARIADEIVPSHKILINRAREVAEVLADKDPVIIKAIKFATNNGLDLTYMDVLKLESKLANFFEWEDTEDHFSALAASFGLQYQLTGDPEKLRTDYEKTQAES
ncbi:MAG: enoyl-CoA hydratase/isomerase family protein [Candidatus Hermodarchaeota archaeon]